MFEKFSVGLEVSPRAYTSFVDVKIKIVFFAMKTLVWIRILIQQQPGSGSEFSESWSETLH
jgi:hypothetical protein